MERDALPRWDLSVIYPSPSSPEFKADVKKVSELKGIIIDNLESFGIRKLLELLNESAALVSNLDSYSAALLSTDTSNSLYMKAVSDALKQGDKVALLGFGTFETAKREARTGINPATKEKIEIPAKTVAKFKAGADLADLVNG